MKKFAANILFILLLSSCSVCFGENFSYKFKQGRTYFYDYSSSGSSKTIISDQSIASNYSDKPISFQIKPVEFAGGSCILDIFYNSAMVRRYVTPKGTLVGAPTETGRQFPFFLSFPKGDIKPNQTITDKQNVFLGQRCIPAIRSLTYKGIDPKTHAALFDFTAQIKLTANTTGKKYLKVGGSFVFDLYDNFLQSASWRSKYVFEYYNKAIAVKRVLWRFEKESSHSVRLTKLED